MKGGGNHWPWTFSTPEERPMRCQQDIRWQVSWAYDCTNLRGFDDFKFGLPTKQR